MVGSVKVILLQLRRSDHVPFVQLLAIEVQKNKTRLEYTFPELQLQDHASLHHFNV